MMDFVSRGSLFALFSAQKNDGVILSRQRTVEGSQNERRVPCASHFEILRRPAAPPHPAVKTSSGAGASGRLLMTRILDTFSLTLVFHALTVETRFLSWKFKCHPFLTGACAVCLLRMTPPSFRALANLEGAVREVLS
jgi:hypothetical protein